LDFTSQAGPEVSWLFAFNFLIILFFINLLVLNSDYNIGMVSQGASQRNITFLVNESEVSQVVKNVFQNFFLNPQKNEH